ncbi:SPOR domain-containing protein [Roseomonas sp. CCTCC AB2023176]|uniref:SPOR domain-containing protein n=1 Tax=Roseomonas sp. CCTCC AB2023176 TaxID=3342640 RepID=UPI0035E005B7
MSDFTVPSYRIRPARTGYEFPWRMMAIAAGGVAVLGALGGGAWYLMKRGSGPVPVIEADNRPIRVRPSDAGGMRVANQDERIFDHGRRGAAPAPAGQQANGQRLAPEPERPNLDALRQAAQPRPGQPAPAPAPAAQQAARPGQPAAAPGTQSAAPPAPTVSGPPAGSLVPLPSNPAPATATATTATGNTGAGTAAPQPAVAAPMAAPPRPVNPRILIQVGALGSEEAARNEWDRLTRRAPELAGRTASFPRADRGPDQAPMWRIRTGGFTDADAARQFCEGLRQKGAPCTVIGG